MKLADYRIKRNKILCCIMAKSGEAFSIEEIRDDLGIYSREPIRDILYRLKNMSFLIRQRNAYHYKFWEATSLMPKNLEELIRVYEIVTANGRMSRRG
jgi:DNA-binding GntR family transcriptional regulator